MTKKDQMRFRNPYTDPLVSELIENPERYRKMFSEQILAGETLQVFRPSNVVLVGPQGTGKTMILNLVRHAVIREWVQQAGTPPGPLRHIEPFLGISINLVRANFHAFGRRSVARARGILDEDHSLDVSCAADFLINYLFRELILGITFVLGPNPGKFREWLGVSPSVREGDVATDLARLASWHGYYKESRSFAELVSRVDNRLTLWRHFLNGNRDDVPSDVWESKASLEGPLHEVGNLLAGLGTGRRRLPLFVVIDQYEVLPELNRKYGTTLQRAVNTLIKLRDPVVFYKIGARTYDWGRELRIWGAESRIEVQRDYALINLSDVLMKTEDAKWLFRDFARDVAAKRLLEAGYSGAKGHIVRSLGPWTPEAEAELYFRRASTRTRAIGPVPDAVRRDIIRLCRGRSALEFRLAGAWATQRLGRGTPVKEVLREMRQRPWTLNAWWRKERVGIALQQVASMANQKRRYFGWRTVLYLAGANISSFLLVNSQIWDMAIKMDADPTKQIGLDPVIQTEGIFLASERWAQRDRNENVGGRQRFAVLHRVGPAIRDALVGDLAISNPGHSGFSIREADLTRGVVGEKVATFLENAVSWAIIEERPHTSKERKDLGRRKWYLHPILSPFFGLPHVRVKEPAYVAVADVHEWLFGTGKIRFPRQQLRQPHAGVPGMEQLTLPILFQR